MIGLKNRGGLPSVVQDEFEYVVGRIRSFFLAEHNEDGTHRPAASIVGLVPIGVIMGYAAATAPGAWLLCDGTAHSRVTYRGLFAVIGVTFGAGDGVLTFNVPDLRQRFLLGKAATGTGSTLAATGGAIDHDHSIDSGGGHDHGGETDDDNGTDGSYQSGADKTGPVSSHDHGINSDGSHNHGGDTGSGNPPYLVANYIIHTGSV